MGKRRAIIALAIALIATVATSVSNGALRAQLFGADDNLLECRQYVHLFPAFPENASDGRDRVLAWRDEYHANVGRVIAAHFAAANDRIQCVDNPGVRPTDALKSLASMVPPWSSRPDSLTEEDFAGVLSVYLDAYECALRERQEGLPSMVAAETQAIAPGWIGAGPSILSETSRQASAIRRELLLARPTLHRALRYAANVDRLLPIHVNLRCLERASLDIRNNMSLLASASACSIRRDGRSTIRELPQ